MSDQPKQYPHVYGFAPDREHFIWPNPEEVESPATPEEKDENASLTEVLDAVTEVAAACPSIAKEMLRILTDEEQQPQQSESSTAQEGLRGRRLVEPERLIVASGTTPADAVGPTADVTIASATIGVTSPPENSRPSNSRARKKSRSRRKKVAPPPKPLSRLARHEAQCGICGDELQEEIDDAFINWEYVNRIAQDFNLDRRAIYRHAHATGLFAKRDKNVRRALGRIIHEADRVTVTADSVVRAVKLLTHVNAHGEWMQPPTHVIFSTATPSPATARVHRAAPKIAPQGDTPCKAKKRLKR